MCCQRPVEGGIGLSQGQRACTADSETERKRRLHRTNSTPSQEELNWNPHDRSFIRNSIEGRKLLESMSTSDNVGLILEENIHTHGGIPKERERTQLLTIDETEELYNDPIHDMKVKQVSFHVNGKAIDT